MGLWQLAQLPAAANTSPLPTSSGVNCDEGGTATGAITGRHAKAENPANPTTIRAANPIANRLNKPCILLCEA